MKYKEKNEEKNTKDVLEFSGPKLCCSWPESQQIPRLVHLETALMWIRQNINPAKHSELETENVLHWKSMKSLV